MVNIDCYLFWWLGTVIVFPAYGFLWGWSAAAAAKSLQSCLTMCYPIDGSSPGSPVPGILQARTLEWVAISFSNAGEWKVKVKSLSRVWMVKPTQKQYPHFTKFKTSVKEAKLSMWAFKHFPFIHSINVHWGLTLSQALHRALSVPRYRGCGPIPWGAPKIEETGEYSLMHSVKNALMAEPSQRYGHKAGSWWPTLVWVKWRGQRDIEVNFEGWNDEWAK